MKKKPDLEKMRHLSSNIVAWRLYSFESEGVWIIELDDCRDFRKWPKQVANAVKPFSDAVGTAVYWTLAYTLELAGSLDLAVFGFESDDATAHFACSCGPEKVLRVRWQDKLFDKGKLSGGLSAADEVLHEMVKAELKRFLGRDIGVGDEWVLPPRDALMLVAQKRRGESIKVTPTKKSAAQAIALRVTSERATLQDQPMQIPHIAWSPDGKSIAGTGGIICLWNPTTGKIEKQIAQEKFEAYAPVSWSPDSNMLATSTASAVLLRDAKTGKVRLNVPLQTQYGGYPLAFSPDGILAILSSVEKGEIKLMDVNTGNTLKALSSPTVRRGAWSPDGRLLAVLGWSGIRVLNPASGKEIWSKGYPEKSKTMALSFSPDSRWLAWGAGGSVLLADARKGQVTRTLKVCKDHVTEIAFSFDGRLVVSKGGDKMIRLWSIETGKPVGGFKDGAFLGWGMAMHPTEPVLATMTPQATALRIWDLDLDSLLRMPTKRSR